MEGKPLCYITKDEVKVKSREVLLLAERSGAMRTGYEQTTVPSRLVGPTAPAYSCRPSRLQCSPESACVGVSNDRT